MPKDNLKSARRLIRENAYDDARDLLKMIDTPKARRLLKRLPAIQRRAEGRARTLPALLIGFVISVGLLGAALYLAVTWLPGRFDPNAAATAPTNASTASTTACEPLPWFTSVMEHLTTLTQLDDVSPAAVDEKLAEVQQTRSAVAALAYPTCAETARSHALAMLTELDTLFQALKQDEPETAVGQQARITAELEGFLAEMERIAPDFRDTFDPEAFAPR